MVGLRILACTLYLAAFLPLAVQAQTVENEAGPQGGLASGVSSIEHAGLAGVTATRLTLGAGYDLIQDPQNRAPRPQAIEGSGPHQAV